VTHTIDRGISTHVLKTSDGLPATGVVVRSQRLQGDAWCDLTRATTDADGRVKSLLQNHALAIGTYRLLFATGDWFAIQKIECFFPTVTIEFHVADATRHYHVPLLLSAFAYATYRGS